MVRGIATQKTLQECHQKRPAFHPYTQVVEAMKEDPGANRRTIMRKAKARVVEAMKEDPGANRRTIMRKAKTRVEAEDTTCCTGVDRV